MRPSAAAVVQKNTNQLLKAPSLQLSIKGLRGNLGAVVEPGMSFAVYLAGSSRKGVRMAKRRRKKAEKTPRAFSEVRRRIITRAKTKGVSEKQLFSNDSLFEKKGDFPSVLDDCG
jgi:hypothetical protein